MISGKRMSGVFWTGSKATKRTRRLDLAVRHPWINHVNIHGNP
jgi:hypothetical protein